MKADGIEYEERMERLQDVSYPKPLEELLFHAYDVYRKSHPWVGDHPLSPKSVVRDMYERAMTFTEFTSFYELARAEGIVLRYLASAYKALDHTVPDDLKSEDLEDLIAWLGEMVRQVDSSLLDEWEQLANPQEETADQAAERADHVKPVTSNARAFRVLVRNAMFRRVELAALEKYEELGELDAESGWDADAWARRHGRLLGRVRGPRHRPRRARAEAAADRGAAGARAVAGPPDLRRPGGRPRLGHHAPRSTWPPPTRRAAPWCVSRPSVSCSPGTAEYPDAARTASEGARMTDPAEPTPSDPTERLVDLLDLERIEENIFRGRSPHEQLQRVFGGQVAGQALVAAGRTTEGQRPVHSLHAYFLRPGRPGVPIVYQVERVRDGRSFTTRRVVAVQQGRTIFNLTASFHRPEPGFEHQLPMPGVPDPESLPTLADELRDHLGTLPEYLQRMARRQAFDIRYVERLRWTPEEIKDAEPRSAVWMRAVGTLGDDPLVHTCALTYASDMMLLDAVRVPVEPLWGTRGFDMASLDHAMWFHRPFRADEWFLYQQESPIATAGRGLARGQIYNQEGRLLVSVMQEGLFRPRDPSE